MKFDPDTDPAEILAKATLLTNLGGAVPVAAALRRKLAFFSDGSLYVATSAASDPDVATFRTIQKRGDIYIGQIEVPITFIARLYEAAEGRGSTVAGNNKQATRLREIVSSAAARRASDIHWVSDGGSVRVSFRIDGALVFVEEFDGEFALDLLRAAYNAHSSAGDNSTQLQVSTDQDGRITSRQILPPEVSSIRISSGPLSGGGSANPTPNFQQVWRLTYGSVVQEGDLYLLGYTEVQAQQIAETALMPYGIVIVGGPTGSGKSTTLQTILTDIYKRHEGRKHVYTIEEPVEMKIPGARQHSTATTSESDEDRLSAFVAATRVMLRRDPDVVMFGEIRDNATASQAVRTALSGRLVFTTLHGNSALDLLLRLMHDLNVGHVLATDHNVFLAFISQSLIPRLCPHCSIPAQEVLQNGHHAHSIASLQRILSSCDATTTRFIGRGCAACALTGVRGRELVAEVVRSTPEIMEHMRNNDKGSATREWLRHGNMTKRMVALGKANQGLIDPIGAEAHVGPLAAIGDDGRPVPLDVVLAYGYGPLKGDLR